MSTTEPSTATSSACARSSVRSTATSTPSKRSMASATGTARSERARRRTTLAPPSRIGRLIVVLNLMGLAILVGGALLLNELRHGLVEARLESLRTEGQVIANVLDGEATKGDPEPELLADDASNIIESLSVPKSERVRL